MRAVAIGADCRLLRSDSDGMAVHALLVRGNHLRAEATLFHYKLLAVTSTAGGRNVLVTYARSWIHGGQQFMWAPVTIDASCGVTIAAVHRLAVIAAVVGCLFVGVAGGTGNFLGSGFVGGTFYIRVAVHAGKHAAVDGLFEGLRIDMQADGLAIDFVGEGGITMAGETSVSRGFGRIFLGRSSECDCG